LTEEARTRTSTSFGAGVGAGRSSHSAAGVSKAVIATAFIYATPKGDGNIDTAGDRTGGSEGSISASVRMYTEQVSRPESLGWAPLVSVW
jgi:hypothetical protein